jgi:hypothetical protein
LRKWGRGIFLYQQFLQLHGQEKDIRDKQLTEGKEKTVWKNKNLINRNSVVPLIFFN